MASVGILHCTACGERLTPDARFCPRCGAASTAGADALVGKIIAERYLLTEKIGQGASGTIYRAEHTTLHRKLAVKILHHQLSRDEAAVERFRREATTVGQIDNDHILQVSDFGRTEDQRLFFAMELLEGEALDVTLTREQRMSPDRVAKILLQICDALGEAHGLGYVHRDLRPRNVFLAVRRGERDFVKLLDFGLAKLIRPDAEMRQTALGMAFGDPRYMSPEQARGDVIDPRSDVYSLGVVAFEMLTGAAPYAGNGPFEVLQKVLDGAIPRVRDTRPDCPAWLDAIVYKAMQKRAEQRYATLPQLVQDLRTEAAPPVAATSVAVPLGVSRAMDLMATPPALPVYAGAPKSRTLLMETALSA